MLYTAMLACFASQAPGSLWRHGREKKWKGKIWNALLHLSPPAGRRVAEWLHGKKSGNPEEQGEYFEGDIILVDKPVLSRNGIDYTQYRWPGGVVYYEFAATVSKWYRGFGCI